MRNFILLLFVFCLFINAKCKKDNPDINGLPPTTQSGNNTLGFLLNGQPWIPKGNNGTANLSIDVDFGFNEGGFSIAAYRLLGGGSAQDIIFGIRDSLNHLSIPISLSLGQNSLFGIRFGNDNCTFYSSDANTIKSGALVITKLDKAARIISGTFSATLSKLGCSDTIMITDGRFDMKY